MTMAQYEKITKSHNIFRVYFFLCDEKTKGERGSGRKRKQKFREEVNVDLPFALLT